jgi:hypothetical protein
MLYFADLKMRPASTMAGVIDYQDSMLLDHIKFHFDSGTNEEHMAYYNAIRNKVLNLCVGNEPKDLDLHVCRCTIMGHSVVLGVCDKQTGVYNAARM